MAIELPDQKRVGMVSLGCPKALVDSERILTRLRADGYAMSPDYAGADVVLVNTCGFLDSAKEESLAAIGEAMDSASEAERRGRHGAGQKLVMLLARGGDPTLMDTTWRNFVPALPMTPGSIAFNTTCVSELTNPASEISATNCVRSVWNAAASGLRILRKKLKARVSYSSDGFIHDVWSFASRSAFSRYCTMRTQ